VREGNSQIKKKGEGVLAGGGGFGGKGYLKGDLIKPRWNQPVLQTAGEGEREKKIAKSGGAVEKTLDMGKRKTQRGNMASYSVNKRIQPGVPAGKNS